MGMLYGSTALPACRALIVISISTGVTGERNKVLSFLKVK